MQVGQEVICNGFPGVVTKVCTGQLEGMVEVRLARGLVCVSIEGNNLIPVEKTR